MSKKKVIRQLSAIFFLLTTILIQIVTFQTVIERQYSAKILILGITASYMTAFISNIFWMRVRIRYIDPVSCVSALFAGLVMTAITAAYLLLIIDQKTVECLIITATGFIIYLCCRKNYSYQEEYKCFTNSTIRNFSLSALCFQKISAKNREKVILQYGKQFHIPVLN